MASSRKEYQMLFQLGAQMGSSFSSTLSKAQSEFARLGNEIQSLQKVQSDISSYQKLQTAITATTSKLENLKAQHNLLQTEIDETTGSTTELEREKLKLEQRIRDTASTLERQQTRLDSTGAALKEAGVNTSNLAGETEKLKNKYTELKSKQDAAAESASDFGTQSVDAVNALSEAFAAAKVYETLSKIKDGFVEAAQASIEYESAVTGVYKTVDGTDEQLAQINAEIKEMSTEMPASASEIAAVAEAAGQLGIATEDVTSFTKVMVDLGESTNLTAEDAATALAKFANITGTSADNYSRLGSVIVDLGNNFATTESDITQMGTRLASAGKLAGLTEPEIFALSAAMSSVGIEAEAGGTAMTQTLSAIEKAVVNGKEALDTYAEVAGMSSKEFAAAWNDNALSALTAFISGLGKLDEQGESATLVLDELGLTGVRQSNMLKSLALAADQMDSAVETANTAWEENTALTTEANKRYGTTESKLDAMQNSFTNLKIAIGDVYTPAIREAADVGNEMLQGLTDFVEENPAVVQGLTTTVGILGAVAAGVSGVTAAMKIGSVVAGTFGLASTAALGPIALGVTAVAALAGGVVYLNNAIEDADEKLYGVPVSLDEITTSAQATTEALSEAQAQFEATAESTFATVGVADTYISKLESMGSYASLSTEQQQEYRNVLTLLTELMPELSDSINTTTGEIEGGTAALRSNIEVWEESAKAEAYEAYMADAASAYNDATTELYSNQLKLTEAQLKAEKATSGMNSTYQKLLSVLGMTDEEFKTAYGSVSNLAAIHFGEQGEEIASLQAEWEGYADELSVAEENARTYQEAVDSGVAAQEEASQAVNDAQAAYEALEAAQEAAAAGASEVAAQSQAVEEAVSGIKDEASQLVEAYKEAYDSAYESVSGQYAIWDEAASVVAVSAGSINDALDSQITYWDNYNQNLESLNERAADIEGLSTVISTFADGSEESVNAIAGMANASDEDLQRMVEKFNELQDTQVTTSESVADLVSQFSNSMDELAQDLADTIADMNMSEEAKKSADATIQGFIDGAESGLSRVQTAYARVANAAAAALNGGQTTIPSYAVGTVDAEPGFAVVGENGPELVYFNGGEQVMTAEETAAMRQRVSFEGAASAPLDAQFVSHPGAVAQGSPINVTFQIQGNATSETVDALRSYGDDLAERIEEIIAQRETDSLRRRYAS